MRQLALNFKCEEEADCHENNFEFAGAAEFSDTGLRRNPFTGNEFWHFHRLAPAIKNRTAIASKNPTSATNLNRDSGCKNFSLRVMSNSPKAGFSPAGFPAYSSRNGATSDPENSNKGVWFHLARKYSTTVYVMAFDELTWVR
jgi:hypothetical protein